MTRNDKDTLKFYAYEFAGGLLGAGIGTAVAYFTEPQDVVAMLLGAGSTIIGLCAGMAVGLWRVYPK
jgi:hypothetical protein